MLPRADTTWGVNKVQKEEEARRPGKEPQAEGMTPSGGTDCEEGHNIFGKTRVWFAQPYTGEWREIRSL